MYDRCRLVQSDVYCLAENRGVDGHLDKEVGWCCQRKAAVILPRISERRDRIQYDKAFKALP